jgi:hypothetical protein
MFYAQKIVPSQQLDLKISLMFLAYRCETCGNLGIITQCCPTTTCQQPKAQSSIPKSTKNGTSYAEAIKTWRKTLPKDHTKEHSSEAAFKLTAIFAALGPSVIAPTPAVGKVTLASFSNKQHLIPLIECPSFHM